MGVSWARIARAPQGGAFKPGCPSGLSLACGSSWASSMQKKTSPYKQVPLLSTWGEAQDGPMCQWPLCLPWIARSPPLNRGSGPPRRQASPLSPEPHFGAWFGLTVLITAHSCSYRQIPLGAGCQLSRAARQMEAELWATFLPRIHTWGISFTGAKVSAHAQLFEFPPWKPGASPGFCSREAPLDLDRAPCLGML